MSITQNGVLQKDDNDQPVMGGTSSVDNATIINSAFDPVTRRLLTDQGSGVFNLTVEEDGGTSVSMVDTIIFDGATVTDDGGGVVTVTVSGGGTVDSVEGTADRITVDSADPANPVVDIASTYVGQTSITTLGTITTGVWNGTAIANANLANSSLTIGSTNIALGATSTTLAGLTSVTSTTFVGNLTGNASGSAGSVAVGGITGLGTGVATALAVNVGSAGAFVTFNGALGTPSSGTVTNLTGTASININGTVGATTPTTGVFTTLVAGSTTSLLLGTAGSAVGNIGFRNATSGTITLAPVTGALGTVTLSLPARTDTLVTLGGTETLTAKTLTSPAITTATLSGAQLLTEGASIQLDPALSADGTYSGITITGTAGATLAFGDLIYLAVADSRWELTDADSATTCGAVLTGMCVLAAASDGDPTVILLQGNIRADSVFPTFTVGANVYAGLTAGDVVTTAPSATDDVVHVVGKALTADSMYFNPSMDYITIV